ncbi:ABC transporter ATP-binding protein [Streptomyces sp. NPDC002132]|uniref:ATP-binding cassette domain-containing protein n=1 Tax=unclassified Streptomyces TaxID=2593676 RepID=UPI00332333C0
MLADEPTSGLDPDNADSVMRALRACAERGAAVLLVTHASAVAQACDERYVLDAGVLHRAGTGAGAHETADEGALG